MSQLKPVQPSRPTSTISSRKERPYDLWVVTGMAIVGLGVCIHAASPSMFASLVVVGLTTAVIFLALSELRR